MEIGGSGAAGFPVAGPVELVPSFGCGCATTPSPQMGASSAPGPQLKGSRVISRDHVHTTLFSSGL